MSEYRVGTDEYGVNHAIKDDAVVCGLKDEAPIIAWSYAMDKEVMTSWLIGDALDACIFCVGDLRGMDPETQDVFAA